MTNDAALFGTSLRDCRRSAGLSQEELAERSGLSIRAISNLERGCTRRPHPDSVRRLADVLQLPDQVRAQFMAAAGLRVAAWPATTTPGDRPARVGSGRVIPRQLPAAVRQFVGRESELAELTALLNNAAVRPPPTVVVSAIEGTAGVGKTALAVHWAHQAANRFPDGQLYVNLRGFDSSRNPMSSAQAVRDMLDALEVPAEWIPVSLDAQAALFRSLLADKRMLVVLDNARDAQQVRPLLPGGAGCMVVITSRNQLASLVAAEGAHALTLDLLTGAEARELLARRLGPARPDAEPEAAAELIELCARLPLALAVTAAHAAARPRLRLGALSEELQEAQRILDTLEAGDALASVRTVFSWSLNNLTAPAARMFGLLGLHPGPDITIPAAASLAGISMSKARTALRELAGANLITEHTRGRFSLHDLLRAYAAEQAAEREQNTEWRAAVERVLDHYLHTSSAAALLLDPSREPVIPNPPRHGVTPERFGGYQEALAWFEAEHQVLISAVTLAAETRFDVCAWQLPWAMATYLEWRGQWDEWDAIQRTALASATRLGDTAGRAIARRLLGHARARLGDYDQARVHLTHCLAFYRQAGDCLGEALVRQSLGGVAMCQDRHADSLAHAGRALDLFRALGNRAGQAGALGNVGWCHALLGHYQQAQKLCRQAVALHRELGDRSGEAGCWGSLGYAEHKLGNLTEAADCHRRALEIFGELGDRYEQAEILTYLGDVCHTAGDQLEARASWQQALDILSELHHPNATQVRARLRQFGRPPRQSRENRPERTIASHGTREAPPRTAEIESSAGEPLLVSSSPQSGTGCGSGHGVTSGASQRGHGR